MTGTLTGVDNFLTLLDCALLTLDFRLTALGSFTGRVSFLTLLEADFEVQYI